MNLKYIRRLPVNEHNFRFGSLEGWPVFNPRAARPHPLFSAIAQRVISVSFVSCRKKNPMMKVISATPTGYQRP
jgi:hypothetical protein